MFRFNTQLRSYNGKKEKERTAAAAAEGGNGTNFFGDCRGGDRGRSKDAHRVKRRHSRFETGPRQGIGGHYGNPTSDKKRGWQANATKRERRRGCSQLARPADNHHHLQSFLRCTPTRVHRWEHAGKDGVCWKGSGSRGARDGAPRSPRINLGRPAY